MILPPLPRPRFLGAEARAVTADGSVVVGFSSNRIGTVNVIEEAFLWTEQEGTISLQPGGWSFSVAMDVSGDGSVVVGRGVNPVTTSGAAFYWTPEVGMVDLRDLLIFGGATNLDGWRLISAEGISADGRKVVGTALDSSGGSQAFVATIGAIPEPSTVALVAFAGAGLIGLAIRRATRLRAT